MSKPKSLEKLLAEYEPIVNAIKLLMPLLNRQARLTAQHDGHGQLAQALALDAARRQKSRPPRGTRAKSIRQRRAQTAKILASLSRTEPRQIKGPTSIGVLIRHKYIQRKDDGWVWTGKPFVVRR